MIDRKISHIWTIIDYLMISILGPCLVTLPCKAQLQYMCNQDRITGSETHGIVKTVAQMLKAAVKRRYRDVETEQKRRMERITKNKISKKRPSIRNKHISQLSAKVKWTTNKLVLEILRRQMSRSTAFFSAQC